MAEFEEDNAIFTEQEVLQFLQEIETGYIKLSPIGDPQVVYADNVIYEASNGWRIVIFNDCNDWDYIEEIVAADGRRISYLDLDKHYPRIAAYEPSAELAWKRYGLPGPSLFRCYKCEAFLKRFTGYEQHKAECGGTSEKS